MSTRSDLPASKSASRSVELTILMPCLNEAETVATCVNKARGFLNRTGIEGEIVVADNGSSDGSPELARKAGARVVHIAKRGYGNALIGGIDAAHGRFVIMADADDSYDFSQLDAFVAALRASDAGSLRYCQLIHRATKIQSWLTQPTHASFSKPIKRSTDPPIPHRC